MVSREYRKLHTHISNVCFLKNFCKDLRVFPPSIHYCEKVHLVIENFKFSNILLLNIAQIAHNVKPLDFFSKPLKKSL